MVALEAEVRSRDSMTVKQASTLILKRNRELEIVPLKTTMKEDICPQKVELQKGVIHSLISMFLMSKFPKRRREYSNRKLPGKYRSTSLRRPWLSVRFHPKIFLS